MVSRVVCRTRRALRRVRQGAVLAPRVAYCDECIGRASSPHLRYAPLHQRFRREEDAAIHVLLIVANPRKPRDAWQITIRIHVHLRLVRIFAVSCARYRSTQRHARVNATYTALIRLPHFIASIAQACSSQPTTIRSNPPILVLNELPTKQYVHIRRVDAAVH